MPLKQSRITTLEVKVSTVNILRCKPQVRREVRKWSGQLEALQSALHDRVQDTADDIKRFTESVVDLICETTEASVPKSS